ncbi:MAG: extracellular solute-binding protein [Elainellaceae cyanobacterium]
MPHLSKSAEMPSKSSERPALSMNRRSLLIALGSWAIAQGVSGCGPRGPAVLDIEFLDSSLPTSLLKEFQRSISGQKIDFAPVETLAALYEHLVSNQEGRPNESWLSPLWKGLGLNGPDDAPSPRLADWLTLGDYWLAASIQNKLIEPLDEKSLPGWDKLPEKWQSLVRRNAQGELSDQGKIWAAPYRWGSLAIAYQIEAFEALGWVPTDWDDLWREDLTRQISLLDSPRAVIGLTLKRLGQTFNEENPDAVADLSQALGALQAQVKTYSSDAYLQPLLLEDTWVAVGWSSDILALLRRDPRYGAVIPASGTALFADVWVRPAMPKGSESGSGSEPSDQPAYDAAALVSQWIEFCWQPETAKRLTIQSYGASPMLVESDRANLPDSLRLDPVLLPDQEVLEKSEFLTPLSETAIAQYQKLWQDMRLGNLG